MALSGLGAGQGQELIRILENCGAAFIRPGGKEAGGGVDFFRLPEPVESGVDAVDA